MRARLSANDEKTTGDYRSPLVYGTRSTFAVVPLLREGVPREHRGKRTVSLLYRMTYPSIHLGHRADRAYPTRAPARRRQPRRTTHRTPVKVVP